ncbi:MAG TPA: hypothetical protein VGK94_14435 [Candidatus Polarisedimenticolia bacterium]|jgi:hypothetical protein
MKILCATAVSLGLAGAALAGEATGVYEDPEGVDRVTVTITDPEGEVGIEHFEALAFSRPKGPGPGSRRKSAGPISRMSLSPDSVASLSGSGRGRARGSRAEGTGEFLVDWSGVRARIQTQGLAGCTVSEAEFVGTVSLGRSVFVDVVDAMSTVSVLSNTNKRGDADLYVFDGDGNEVCRSVNSRRSRIADQCTFLDTSCSVLADSTVEVHGFNLLNRFHLKIWYTQAF